EQASSGAEALNFERRQKRNKRIDVYREIGKANAFDYCTFRRLACSAVGSCKNSVILEIQELTETPKNIPTPRLVGLALVVSRVPELDDPATRWREDQVC